MIQFIKRNILKTFRNGLIIGSTINNNISDSNSNSNTGMIGNYLPAKLNGDEYIVDLSQVTFTGNIRAFKEITAYASGSLSDSDNPKVTIYDGLDSTDPNLALSANMGHELKNMIDNIKVPEGGSSHTHANKDVLDTITNNKVNNWDSAFTDKHTHKNKTILDKISQQDIDKWNNSASGETAHSHANKDVLDTISQEKVNNWDSAVKDKHTHTNKDVLDTISQEKVNNWDTMSSDWKKVFYIDQDGNLRCKVNFIGEQEVSSFAILPQVKTMSNPTITIDQLAERVIQLENKVSSLEAQIKELKK